jgi:hypothetical protein
MFRLHKWWTESWLAERLSAFQAVNYNFKNALSDKFFASWRPFRCSRMLVHCTYACVDELTQIWSSHGCEDGGGDITRLLSQGLSTLSRPTANWQSLIDFKFVNKENLLRTYRKLLTVLISYCYKEDYLYRLYLKATDEGVSLNWRQFLDISFCL